MSKEKLLLGGAGGFGRMVAEQAMLQYDCAFVDDGQSVGAEICGIPVVGSLADLPELRKEYSLLVVGIGNNQLRAQVYEKAKSLGYAFPNIIAPSAYCQSVMPSRLWLCGAAKRLYPEWCVCRKRCSAECRNGSPL
ncbi:MAG: hypothetical protein ACLUGI_01435 [Subdoligranulum sp.]